tara:strand:- start:38 stop:400 length:363 start_codon:yes stop_codon:yes gene_type:complete
MFKTENEPLALLIELTPRLAKKRFRQSIYEAWNYECGYCGAPATSLDHIIPKFRSGSSNCNNLIPACRSCNHLKASTNMEEWYRKQSFFTEPKLEAIIKWTEGDKIEVISEVFLDNLGYA